MTYETRTMRPDELIPWLECVNSGFLERPNNERIAEQLGPYWDFTRLWGTFDGPVVGTLRSWATEVTVPGRALVPATGISGVTVRPTHRREGILRQMIAAEHAAARERGEQLAILYVSKAPIYGRFGYGVAVQPCTWVLDARSTSFAGGPASGMDFGLIELEWDGPWKGWVAVHRDAAGDPDGFVRYTADSKWEHRQPRRDG